MTETKVSVPQQPKVTPRRFPKNQNKQSKLPVRHNKPTVTPDLQNLTNNVTTRLQQLVNKYKSSIKSPVKDQKALFLRILNREPFKELRQVDSQIREQKKKKANLLQPQPPKQSKEEIRLNSAKEQTEKLKAEIEELEKENTDLRYKRISNNLCKRKVGSVAMTKLRSTIQQLLETNHVLEQNIELIERRIRLMTQHRSSLHISELVMHKGLPATQEREIPALPPLSSTLTLVRCCSFTITNI